MGHNRRRPSCQEVDPLEDPLDRRPSYDVSSMVEDHQIRHDVHDDDRGGDVHDGDDHDDDDRGGDDDAYS